MGDREIWKAYLRDVCCGERLCEEGERALRRCQADIALAPVEAPGNYLRYAGFLEDLYALAGIGMFSLCAALLGKALHYRFLGTFFAIAAAAFLVSFLAVLALKLIQGRRNYEACRKASPKSRELQRLSRRLERAKELRSQLYSVGVIPEHCRSAGGIWGVYQRLCEGMPPEEALQTLQPSEPPDALLHDRTHLALEPEPDLHSEDPICQAMISQIRNTSAFFRTQQ